MDELYPWLGNLYSLEGLSREITGIVCIVAAVICGAVVGMERERRDKPAGLRTTILICVGSTIFTMASILIAEESAVADPSRIASHIVPGIGFLGAGAIIVQRGTVQGLTTGATIWTVAAVGVIAGSGYVAASLGFTVLVVGTLVFFRRVESLVHGPCRHGKVLVRYRTERGLTRARLQAVVDTFAIPDEWVREGAGETPEEPTLIVTFCRAHRQHRSILKDLADCPGVVGLEVEGALAPLVPAG